MNHLETYQQFRSKLEAYKYALWMISWDSETEAPEKAIDYRAKQIEVLSTLSYEVETDEARILAIDELAKNNNVLSKELQREIYLVKKELDQMRKIPKDQYIAFQVLITQAAQIWSNAKNNNDFNAFLPTLEKVIAFQKTMIKYLETDTLKGYDVLLDLFEPGMKVIDYDYFFDTLKTELVPFAVEVSKIKQKYPSILKKGNFDRNRQIEFNQYLMDVFRYDLNRGVLKESPHPFTSGVASVDTRITTHYYENNLRSAIFSTVHEMGHAIYEQQVNPDYDYTELKGGVSMGIHESQSRMFENMIARSDVFWQTHYHKLQEVFKKELKNVSLEDFIHYVNEVKRDFIRIEADELTYSLHIMVRYEIEKMLFNGKLKAADLPKVWNRLYKKYLGITPKTDKQGVLQDVHWSFGHFGYFPTYALGSAISAQLYNKMDQKINIEACIQNNELEKVNAWLKENIHQYGKLIEPKALILDSTGEPFNPHYYVDYLKNKYTKLFNL